MPFSPIVLLDTMVVAALYAVSKQGSHVEVEKTKWRESVRELVASVSPRCLVRVPTPVCYELMAMNVEWFNYIGDSSLPLFRFSSASITNNILRKAAKYSFEANCVSTDGDKQKMKTMDPLIASYALDGNHYMLTTNQHDFPESHFSICGIKALSLSGKNGPHRTILYLLKPKSSNESSIGLTIPTIPL